jgi:hypothetical protein
MTALILLLTVHPAAVPLAQAEPPAERLLNSLILLLLLLLIGLCLIAGMVMLAALLPGISQRSQAALLRSPWRAFFIGLANYLFLGAIVLVLVNAGNDLLGLLGLIGLLFLAAVTFLGLPSLARLTGERLAHLRQQEMSPWQHLVWGTVVLELAALLPVLGWVVLAPIIMMLSFGAAVLAWRGE